MARTPITAQVSVPTSAVLASEAANVDGNSVLLRSGVKNVLFVVNGSGGAVTVTLQTPGQVSGLGIADRTQSVAAGATRHFLLDDVLRRGSDDYAYIDYSAVTSVTVYVIQVPVV